MIVSINNLHRPSNITRQTGVRTFGQCDSIHRGEQTVDWNARKTGDAVGHREGRARVGRSCTWVTLDIARLWQTLCEPREAGCRLCGGDLRLLQKY
jgi:hypothetical protein